MRTVKRYRSWVAFALPALAAACDGSNTPLTEGRTIRTEGRPEAPTQLAATYVDGAGLTLNWSDNSNNERQFIVERDSGSTGYREVGTASLVERSGGTGSFVDATYDPQYAFTYRVASSNFGGKSLYSNTISVPRAPYGLTGRLDTANRQLILSWVNPSSENADVEQMIEKRDRELPWTVLINRISSRTTTFSDSPVTGGDHYSYRVRACLKEGQLLGCSQATNVIATTSNLNQPGLSSIAEVLTVAGAKYAKLSWLWAAGQEPIVGFNVYRRLASEGYSRQGFGVAPSSRSAAIPIDANMVGREVCFRMNALSRDLLESRDSREVCLTP